MCVFWEVGDNEDIKIGDEDEKSPEIMKIFDLELCGSLVPMENNHIDS